MQRHHLGSVAAGQQALQRLTLSQEPVNGVGVTRSYGQYAQVGWKYVLPHSPDVLEGLVRAIDHEEIDVLTLSEAEGGSFRSRGINYVSWFAERTELRHHLLFPTFRRSFRGRMLTNQGNAVLSRYPLLRHENHRLPGSGEPRYLGEATIAHEASTFTVFTTHLSLQRLGSGFGLGARIGSSRRSPPGYDHPFEPRIVPNAGDISASVDRRSLVGSSPRPGSSTRGTRTYVH